MSLVVTVDRVDVAFPGCQAHNGFHILNWLSTLSKTRDELSEGRCGTGSLRYPHVHAHSYTHTHTLTYLLAKLRNGSEIMGESLCGWFCFCILPVNTEPMWLHTTWGLGIGGEGHVKFYDG